MLIMIKYKILGTPKKISIILSSNLTNKIYYLLYILIYVIANFFYLVLLWHH